MDRLWDNILLLNYLHFYSLSISINRYGNISRIQKKRNFLLLFLIKFINSIILVIFLSFWVVQLGRKLDSVILNSLILLVSWNIRWRLWKKKIELWRKSSIDLSLLIFLPASSVIGNLSLLDYLTYHLHFYQIHLYF